MNLADHQALERLRLARVARLATASSSGQPHVVPVTFAVNNRIAVTAIDHKPKTSGNLRRLRNIKENSRVSLLVDEYDDRDWTRLWWVRADGAARVIEDVQECAEPFSWLYEKYGQYRENPLSGPLIWISIETLRSWSCADW